MKVMIFLCSGKQTLLKTYLNHLRLTLRFVFCVVSKRGCEDGDGKVLPSFLAGSGECFR